MSHLTRSQQGELIEGYPEDVRGHSGLIHGTSKHRRDIHVVCAIKEEDFLANIKQFVYVLETESDMICMTREGWEVVKAIMDD